MIYRGMAELHNTVELLDDAEPGPLMLRVPSSLRAKLNESARLAAGQAAGSEIRFNLDGGEAQVILMTVGNTAIVERFSGPFRSGWFVVGSEPTPVPDGLHDETFPDRPLKKAADFSGSGFDPALCRIILPCFDVRLVDIKSRGGRVSPPRPGQVPARRFLAYGSSITHGRSAVLPSSAWAMRVARLTGSDLVNLGLSGGAHLEKEMADYIAERRDWDFATLELGINMVSKFETAEFRRRVEYFLERIAREHPEKWIFCLSMFSCRRDLDPGFRKNGEFRKIVRETVAGLAASRVVYLDGRRLLRDFGGLTADLLHPADAGMEEIARGVARAVVRRISER